MLAADLGGIDAASLRNQINESGPGPVLSDRRPTRRIRRLAVLVPLMAAALFSMFAPRLVAQKLSRDEVQAAYLYNFGKFVRWPGDAGHRPMLVCVAGEDAFADTVRKLVDGEQIDGRPLEVRDVDRSDTVDGCSMLFIGAQVHDREDSLLSAAASRPILTVGDSSDFLERGGMIQFLLVEDHVRFAVNLDECNRHGVALSSELLKVAVAVRGKSASGGAK